MSRIIFHRPARVLPPQLPTEPVVLAAPPQPVGRDANNWLMLLMPLMTSFSMAAYLMAGGRKLLILLGICFVVVSIGTTFGIRLQLRRNARRDKLRARDRYLAHLVDVRRTARQVAESQRVVAAWAYPSPYRLWAIATRRRRVWERRITDPDFLSVCVGVGTAALATPIRMATRNDPTVEYDPRAKSAADRLIASMSTVGSQPATVDLSRGGVVSVLGPTDVARGVARAVVCQIAVLHAPDDVGLVVVGDADVWGWTKWLPHTHEPDAAGAAGVVPLVAEEFDGVADHLRDTLDRFAEQPAVRRGFTDRDAPDTRRRLVVVLDGYDPRAGWARSQTAAELLAAAGPDSGITVLCVVGREQDEPSRADVRVRVDDEGALALDVRSDPRGGPSRQDVTRVLAEWPEVVLCEAIARELAPLRLSVEGEEVLAQVTSLPSMLGITDTGDFDPEELWVAADDDTVLRMPLGFDGSGQPLELDLKEAAQGGMGPHGLVVGATGSGKSELLRTLVTGLAATHSPELLSFVLVDFKGGATFAGLAELPHAAGMITNLTDDLALVDRVRDALVGEQQRRQRILRDAGNIDNIRDYQSYRAAGRTAPDGSPLPPLPYLLVIVDEFGELLSSRPDFTELFVQIGRVGRSLGMHLLLATQRLEEGRLRGLDANLSYRICLRTFSPAESRVVIGTPDAYQLPPIPGSAYLKVADAVYERFRVAHVSGPHRAAAGRPAGEPEAAPPVVFGLRVPPAPGTEPAPREQPAASRPAIGGPTEMQVIVERLRAAGQAAHQVWLPPLPPALPLDDLTGPAAARPGRGLAAEWWPAHGGLRFPIGVSDLPSQQVQQPLVADFVQAGHLMAIGAPQSGKSTLLRTLMLSAMLTTPRTRRSSRAWTSAAARCSRSSRPRTSAESQGGTTWPRPGASWPRSARSSPNASCSSAGWASTRQPNSAAAAPPAACRSGCAPPTSSSSSTTGRRPGVSWRRSRPRCWTSPTAGSASASTSSSPPTGGVTSARRCATPSPAGWSCGSTTPASRRWTGVPHARSAPYRPAEAWPRPASSTRSRCLGSTAAPTSTRSPTPRPRRWPNSPRAGTGPRPLPSGCCRSGWPSPNSTCPQANRPACPSASPSTTSTPSTSTSRATTRTSWSSATPARARPSSCAPGSPARWPGAPPTRPASSSSTSAAAC